MQGENLTAKQKRFCQEYVIDLNATQACIRAGYAEDSAHVEGSRLLSNDKVVEYVRHLQEQIQERLEITADKVILELAKCGFSNIQDFIGEDNSTVDLSAVERNKAAAISSVKVTSKSYGKDEPVFEQAVEFKLYDKVTALEKIGRHLGIFEKDNAQSKIVIGADAIKVKYED